MIIYLLSFAPGSQGRFLDLLVKTIIDNKSNDNIADCLAEFNSWHHDFLYNKHAYFLDPSSSFSQSTLSNFNHLITDPDATVSLRTHMSPNWEILKLNDNIDRFRFIIIQIDREDALEIHANIIYKNYVRDIKLKEESLLTIRSNCFTDLFDRFQNLYGTCSIETFQKEMTTDFDKVQAVIRDSFKTKHWQGDTVYFIQPKVDAQFVDKTLIINYRDLFDKINNRYPMLDKISDFFKISYNKAAVDFCDYNRKNRLDFIDSYMYNLEIRR